ncbi:Scr1 family TA system antitoxin-like transcriptional regulator [Streptomyces sp. NPDC003642]
MATHKRWSEQLRDGLRPLQERSVPRYQATERFRVYSSTLVPGLLQTESYAAAVLRVAARSERLPVDDSAEAARARVARSRVLHDEGRQFTFVVEEAVLYCQMPDRDTMSAQLNALLAADTSSNVSLGIIPMVTPEPQQWPQETFHVFDDCLVSVELVTEMVEVAEPSEVAQYIKAFEELRSMAVYGAQARVLRAIESLR